MRTQRMRELIDQRTQQLKDHETGHRRLNDDVRQWKGNPRLSWHWKYVSLWRCLLLNSQDHARFNRQINAFKRKLEQLDGMSDEVCRVSSCAFRFINPLSSHSPKVLNLCAGIRELDAGNGPLHQADEYHGNAWPLSVRFNYFYLMIRKGSERTTRNEASVPVVPYLVGSILYFQLKTIGALLCFLNLKCLQSDSPRSSSVTSSFATK